MTLDERRSRLHRGRDRVRSALAARESSVRPNAPPGKRARLGPAPWPTKEARGRLRGEQAFEEFDVHLAGRVQPSRAGFLGANSNHHRLGFESTSRAWRSQFRFLSDQASMGGARRDSIGLACSIRASAEFETVLII